MNFPKEKIVGIKVINIFEETASAIEKMINTAIEEIDTAGKKIMDIQITEDNIFFILYDAEKKETP